MPYYKDKNILFIHIPKTGGTIIENQLKLNCKQTLYSGKTNELLAYPYNNISLQHQVYNTIYKYRDKLSVDFNNIKMFSLVRNPYDRLISDLIWFKLIDKNYTSDQVYKVFVNNYISRSDLDNHNIPQYKFLVDDNSKLNPNIEIFKCETLNENNDKINECLGVNIDIIQDNVNKDYSIYLNQNTIDLVNKIYKKDFELFQYKMK